METPERVVILRSLPVLALTAGSATGDNVLNVTYRKCPI